MCPQAPSVELQNEPITFARQDRTLARHLGALSEQEAMDSKLAAAIEAGRVYGIRQQKYDMLLKKQVNQQAKHPLTQPMY